MWNTDEDSPSIASELYIALNTDQLLLQPINSVHVCAVSIIPHPVCNCGSGIQL